mgnify:CR=1 FL=1
MAIANDDSYDNIFSYQLENMANSNDALLVISGSGNSKNIVNAMVVAKKKNIPIIDPHFSSLNLKNEHETEKTITGKRMYLPK